MFHPQLAHNDLSVIDTTIDPSSPVCTNPSQPIPVIISSRMIDVTSQREEVDGFYVHRFPQQIPPPTYDPQPTPPPTIRGSWRNRSQATSVSTVLCGGREGVEKHRTGRSI